MFVPSLSWQNDALYIYMAQKMPFFAGEIGASVAPSGKHATLQASQTAAAAAVATLRV